MPIDKDILEKLQRKDASLKELDLRGKKLTVADIRLLCKALKGNTSLRTLNLGYNDLGDEGVRYLAEGLSKNTTLQWLDLGGNDLTEEGAKYIVQIEGYLTRNQWLARERSPFSNDRASDTSAPKGPISANIHEAAKNGDLDEIKRLLKENPALLNEQDNEGRTPLHTAAECGHLNIVRYLVDEEKVPVNEKNGYGYGVTPLHCAVENGHLAIVSYFVGEKGVSCDESSAEGFTPLRTAIQRGHLTIVRYLVDRGANLYEKNRYGWTLLHEAAGRGRFDIVQYLVNEKEMPLDEDEKTSDGRTIFDLAKECKDKEKGAAILAFLEQAKMLRQLQPLVKQLSTLQTIIDTLKNEQANNNNTQTFQAQLIKQIEEQQLKFKQETLSDYQKLASTLEHQDQRVEQELNGVHAEIEKVKAELKENPEQTELKEKLKVLEAKQAPLIAAYEAQQALLAHQTHLLSRESLARFYRVLQGHLLKLFAACEVIGSGLVVRKEVGKAEKAVQYLILAGENIPLPGAQAITACLGYIFKKKAGDRVDVKLHHIAEQVISFAEIDMLAEETARRLAFMYEEQLIRLDAEQATLLGESAMKLMLAYLWAGEYKDEKMPDQLISSVAQIKTKNESSQWLEKLRQQIKELSNKFQDTKLTTKTHEQWTAFGVFRCPGIEVKVKEITYYYSGQGTRPDIYGYRQGNQAEAESAKLNRTNDRVDFRLNTVRLTSSTEKHLNTITSDNKATHDKVERLEKQVSHLANQVAATSSPLISSLSQVTWAGLERNNYFVISQAPGFRKIQINRVNVPKDKEKTLDELLSMHGENCMELNVIKSPAGKINTLIFHDEEMAQALVDVLYSTFEMQCVSNNVTQKH